MRLLAAFLLAIAAAATPVAQRPWPAAADTGFDEAAARLRAGRSNAKARTGRIDLPGSDHGNPLDNVLEVPADYDPSRA